MNSAIDTIGDIHAILKDKFGYTSFRPLQEEIINHILAGENALVIMPTGGGKSLCFQIPALAMDGLTIVVSPLIALMKDQVEALRANGIKAAAINSNESAESRMATMTAIQDGTLKLLYVSPEKAVSPDFLQFIEQQNVSMIAIDETHCVSIWGNDFRPEYAELPKLLSLFPGKPTIALTATADKATQSDILKQLNLVGSKMFLSTFERKNLFLNVSAPSNRIKQIDTFLKKHEGQAGIVYCLSRKSTESVAAKLNGLGYNASFFHAAMSIAEKNRVQDAFQKDEVQIICATIAFGMGIDKSNIRWVIHYNLPKNVESYYQEIGRAGRDGTEADLLLFSNYSDVKTYRGFIDDSDAAVHFKSVQLSKIERMWDFAQATSCRTNVILNYFGENRSEPCGHCDNCKQPPVGFDGTIIAQKALSAVFRIKQTAPLSIVVDILRGSYRKEITSMGYDQIKTFGAGRQTSKSHWMEYMTQLVHLGLLEIDYTDGSKLKLTPLSKGVLLDGEKINLTQPREWSDSGSRFVKKKPKKVTFADELEERLMELRKVIAGEDGVAPINVFADSTIKEMVKGKVVFRPEFLKVSGMSAYKYERYGQRFLDAIRTAFHESDMKGIKGKTHLETLRLYNQDMSVNEIARHRDIGRSTVITHLALLVEKEEPIDIAKVIPLEELEKIAAAWIDLGKPIDSKILHAHFDQVYEYAQLKLAVAWAKQ